MFNKVRAFAGDGSTHLLAGVIATIAHENPVLMIALLVLIAIIGLHWGLIVFKQLTDTRTKKKAKA